MSEHKLVPVAWMVTCIRPKELQAECKRLQAALAGIGGAQ